MMASLVAIYYLLLELLLRPFQWRQQKIASECSKEECYTDEDDAASICTEATIETVCLDANIVLHNQKLILTDFVAHSSPQDTLELCELLERYQLQNMGRRRNPLRSIVFCDTVQGVGYRRWLFKKSGVYRRLLKVAQTFGMDLQFDTTVEICTDSMAPKVIVSLLQGLKSDPDVKSLTFSGNIHFCDAIRFVNEGLLNLLQADYRHWKTICLKDLEITASNSKEALLARKSCQRSLQKVAAQRYIKIQMV